MTPEERLHGFLNALETAMDKYDVRPVASFTLTSGPVLEVETVPQHEFLASLKTSDGGVEVIATKTGVNTGKELEVIGRRGERLYAYRSTDPRNNDRGHYADSVDATVAALIGGA